MAYLGYTLPNQAFSGVRTASFNGTGSQTVFLLPAPAANALSLEVIVNNVQQSPYDSSYTVNGSTLTFDEAPSAGTNNIYVIYRDQAFMSTVPTDGSVTTAKIADNAITTAKILQGAVIPADLSTGGPSWDTSGNLSLTGRFTAPNQPAFYVFNNATQAFSGTGTTQVDITNKVFDRTNSFNTTTNVFTAPVSGVYMFCWYGMMMGQSSSTTFVNLSIRINGSMVWENMQQSFSKADYNTITGTSIHNILANDTVDWVIYRAGANAGSYLRDGSTMNGFLGYLIG